MRWDKKGVIFAPQGGRGWMMTHAALPVAQILEGDRLRIYFCSRDVAGRSQIGYLEIDLAKPDEIVVLGEEPVIQVGPLGSFDDSGVTSSCVVSHEGKQYQYYTGWTRGVTVPFYFYIGLATSSNGGITFEKVSMSPIVDRNADDPYLTASPCVLIEGGVWRMWYVSGTRWASENGRPKHFYHIRYAESFDGVHWHRTGTVCVDFKSSDEYAIARPCVLRDSGGYKMWYSYRGERYRIGYAESNDGIRWVRKDEEVGIDVSPEGWDSDMIEYPFVFDHGGRRYMLYNGNGYGITGIGLAVLVEGS